MGCHSPDYRVAWHTVNHAVFQRITDQLPLVQAPWKNEFGATQWPQAAVLVALTQESEPTVLLGRRALHLNHHPGEIAFAGGKREAQDMTPWDTACREAMEEVGLPSDVITPLGELEPMVTRTGFQVFPCIAAIPAQFEYVVDRAEFGSLLSPRLAAFADTRLYELRAITKGGATRMVPHYQLGEDNVWGVTAAILVLLANVAYDAGLDLQRNWEAQP